MSGVVSKQRGLSVDALQDDLLLGDVHDCCHEAQPILSCEPWDLVLSRGSVIKRGGLDDHVLLADANRHMPALMRDPGLARSKPVGFFLRVHGWLDLELVLQDLGHQVQCGESANCVLAGRGMHGQVSR